MKKKHLICIILLALIVSSPARADRKPSQQIDLYLLTEHFKWQEPSFDVEEAGLLYGAGATLQTITRTHLLLQLKLEGFLGEIPYDGHKQDGTDYKTKTQYAGLKVEGAAGGALDLAPVASIYPYVGLGGRWWKRRLDNISGNPLGYDEDWLMLYAMIGFQNIYRFHNTELFCDWNYRLPLYNQETVYLGPGFHLEPGREQTHFVEFGIRTDRHRISIFYEQLLFAQSERDSGVYQPRSKGDITGITLGISF